MCNNRGYRFLFYISPHILALKQAKAYNHDYMLWPASNAERMLVDAFGVEDLKITLKRLKLKGYFNNKHDNLVINKILLYLEQVGRNNEKSLKYLNDKSKLHKSLDTIKTINTDESILHMKMEFNRVFGDFLAKLNAVRLLWK